MTYLTKLLGQVKMLTYFKFFETECRSIQKVCVPARACMCACVCAYVHVCVFMHVCVRVCVLGND